MSYDDDRASPLTERIRFGRHLVGARSRAACFGPRIEACIDGQLGNTNRNQRAGTQPKGQELMCANCGGVVSGRSTVVIDGWGRLCLDCAEQVAALQLRELGQCGPYDSADDAVNDFNHTAMDAAGRGNGVRLAAACRVAGANFDSFAHRPTLMWLCDQLEPAVVQVLVGLVTRAVPPDDDYVIDTTPADGDYAEVNMARLTAACNATGVEPGEYDLLVIEWLAQQCDQTIVYVLARLMCSTAPADTG